MGICFQPWNKIAEYNRRVFVYQFSLVHLAALLNETNLSKRKRTQTVEYLLYIGEAILFSLSVNILFFFGVCFRSNLIFRHQVCETDKQSEKHASFISPILIDFASKFAKIEPHKIKEFKKL